MADPARERLAEFKPENAASGIKGCDAVWPYDQDAAYAGMKRWAETLAALVESLTVKSATYLATAKFHERKAAALARDLADAHKALRRIERLAADEDSDAEDNIQLVWECANRVLASRPAEETT